MPPTDFQHAKRYGQNFLTSPGMQCKIIAEFAAHYDGHRPLVEIGPGVGDLTQFILKHNPLLLEIDPRAVEVLQAKFPDLTVRTTDALADLEQRAAYLPANFYLFANLPYNVGSRMLVALGQHYSRTPFTVILQQEVAYKARLDEANLTLFGAWLNFVWDLRVPFKITKGNFTPAPRVDSAMLQGTPKNRADVDLPRAFAILKALFVHPKKTLANNLKNLDWTPEQIQAFHVTHQLPLTTRLNADNYANLLLKILATK